MARKTKEDAQATREAILDAALQVFSVYGVSRTSLADIAKKAGVTRGAIYWHFANKEDLLKTLWDQLILPFEPFCQASESPDEPDPLGKLREVFIFLFSSFDDDPRRKKLFRVFLDKCEAAENASAIHLRHLSSQVSGFGRIEIVLRNAIDKGQLPPDIDVRLAAIAVVSYIDGLIANRLMISDLFDIKTEAPVLIDGLFQLLRSGFIRPEQT